MKGSENYKTQLAIVVGFLGLSYFFEIDWLRHVSLALGVTFLLSERATHVILWVWQKVGFALGWVNTKIILTVIFYLFLFPIALLFQLFNRDSLRVRWRQHTSTFFERNHSYSANDLQNPW